MILKISPQVQKSEQIKINVDANIFGVQKPIKIELGEDNEFIINLKEKIFKASKDLDIKVQGS